MIRRVCPGLSGNNVKAAKCHVFLACYHADICVIHDPVSALCLGTRWRRMSVTCLLCFIPVHLFYFFLMFFCISKILFIAACYFVIRNPVNFTTGYNTKITIEHTTWFHWIIYTGFSFSYGLLSTCTFAVLKVKARQVMLIFYALILSSWKTSNLVRK